MKALTIHQPWATLCVTRQPCDICGPHALTDPYGKPLHPMVKWIETRSWPAPASLIGQRIAIHASKRHTERTGDAAFQAALGAYLDATIGAALPLGAVVGSAVLTACHAIGHLTDEGITLVSAGMGEMRRPIPGFPRYEAALDGTIWTTLDHRFPGQRLNPQHGEGRAYPEVALRADNGSRRPHRVHTLIAAAWLRDVPGAYLIRHLDGDVTNNAAWNLRRGTDSDNMRDALRLGERPMGADRPGAKLTADQVADARRRFDEGEPLRSLARSFGVDRATMRRLCYGHTYKAEVPPVDDSLAEGRWAWLLADAAPTTERCPACWGDGAGGETRRDELVGRIDVLDHEPGQSAWDEMQDCLDELRALRMPPCLVCAGAGRCDPVPARGRQRVWEWAPA